MFVNGFIFRLRVIVPQEEALVANYERSLVPRSGPGKQKKGPIFVRLVVGCVYCCDFLLLPVASCCS